MKRLILMTVLLVLFSGCVISHYVVRPGSNLNAYKYVLILPSPPDPHAAFTQLSSMFSQKGFVVIDEFTMKSLSHGELKKALVCKYSYFTDIAAGAHIQLDDYLTHENVYDGKGEHEDVPRAIEQAFAGITKEYTGFSEKYVQYPEREAQQKAEALSAGSDQVIASVLWRAPQQTRGLFVGIGSFKDASIPKVDNASSDARYFASIIESNGIPKKNINCMIDEEATRSDITDALMKLKMATTEESETAIVYFSGHGAPIVKDGKIADAVLVPFDARESSLEYTGIKISMLREMLSETRGNWIVILDACFSGKEGRSLMTKNVKAIAVVPKEFNIVSEAKKNLWWVTATSGDNFANDFPKGNHGLFTYYFLKALNGERGVDANKDGLISLREAFDWTKEEVQDVSAKSLGRLQVPGLIGRGDVILTIPR